MFHEDCKHVNTSLVFNGQAQTGFYSKRPYLYISHRSMQTSDRSFSKPLPIPTSTTNTGNVTPS